LRPHQWLKNLLVFIPLLAAHKAGPAAFDAMLAFVSFSYAPRASICLNDLLDLDADRRHSRKRFRPFASGAVPLAQGALLLPILLAGALGIAVCCRLFSHRAVLYFALTLGYSCCSNESRSRCTVLACLYGTRIAAGSAATGIRVSAWLLAFSLFFVLRLALIKRCTELIDRREAGAGDPPGRGYQLDDLVCWK